jgi:membrane-bound lytic murein transglycosylase D
VKRAVDKNTARGLPTDYPSLTMPNETRHYVPKLQALKNIFGDPVLMTKMHIPEILNRPYFGTIETGKPMDVKTVARLANMPLGEFVALNPSHNRPVMKADTSLVLPADKLEIFRSNLEKNAAPLTEWQTYTLKHGEKVDKVAPRFGIALPELLRVNGLSGKVRLGAGSVLLVPAGNGADDLETHQHIATLPQIIEPEPVIAKGRGRTVAAGKKGPVSQTALQAGAIAKASPLNAKLASSKPVAKPVVKTAQAAKPNTNTNANAKAVVSSKPVAPGKVAKSANGRSS